MTTIPIDIVFRIFHYLTFVQLFQVERTSRDFRDVAHSLMWSWKKIEKPHTSFKRVRFNSKQITTKDFILYVDVRLWKFYSGDKRDELLIYLIVKNQFSHWMPYVWSQNYFDTIAVDVYKKNPHDICVWYGTKWSSNGGVIIDKETSNSLFKMTMRMDFIIKIVDPLVIKNL